MIAFYRAYPSPSDFSPQAVAKTDSSNDSLLWSIPWGHHDLLLAKIKDPDQRTWYMAQTLENGWSRNILLIMLQFKAHQRQGKAITNFVRSLRCTSQKP